jgi:TonB-dependent receptor
MTTFNKLVPSVLLASVMLTTGSAIAQDSQPTDEIVVRGTRIPDEKKATSEISSIVDADDFERTGDTDIAGALSRVAGLSINDGRFVIVRGLNERYSSATLNGLPLPSPEPLRRAAPLDLFPTSVLESSLVQKTFSPQYSGEFGGGLVELRTKSIPDENFLTVGVTFSANTETTLNDGLFYEGSDTDVFGFDDGLRDLPTAATALFPRTGITQDVQNAADTSFEQFDTLLINEDSIPGNGSGSIALGRQLHDGEDMRVGTVFYASYGNEWQHREGNRTRGAGVNSSTTDFDQTRQEISIAGLSSTGFEFGNDHEIKLTGLLVRKSLKRAGIATQEFTGDDRTFLLETTDFIERQLWQSQLTGEHTFASLGDLGVEWQLGYGQAERDAPYNRSTGFRLDETTGDFLFTVEEGISNIDFRTLEDENFAAGVDFKYPLTVGDNIVDVSFGADYTETNRETAGRLFEFRGTFPSEIVGSRADLIFSDEILGLSGPRVNFTATTGEPDNFEGSLEVFAAYAAADIELGPYLRAAVGVRFEDGTQETETFLTRDPADRTSFAPIEEDYVLPAVTLTWNPVGDFQLRGGFSQTITRPQFRELSPSIFTDTDIDFPFVGNPFLVNSEIDNFDLRAEWYFSRGQFATVGLFYKDITNPIEDAILSTEVDRSSFANAPSAELMGVEVEYERNFALADLFGENDFTLDKDFVFKTNYTYTQSEVSAGDNDNIVLPNISGQGVTASVVPASAFIEDGSSLVGQSDHLFNLQLGFEQEDGARSTLLVNYASERTLLRGVPVSAGVFRNTVVEEPPITVDFVVNQPLSILGGDYDLTLKIQNILDDDYEAFNENDDASVETSFLNYDLGRTISFGIKRDF